MNNKRELISEQDYQRALMEGHNASNEVHAVRASYNARSYLLTIIYSDNFRCSFDVRKAPLLQAHVHTDLSRPLVTPGSDGIIFEGAGLSLNVPMLVAKSLPVDIGKSWAAFRQGSRTSGAKAAAARINGARGGRPRKKAVEITPTSSG